ncbi:MAG: glycosyl transferase group 1 [Phycisphaerales bacterium]|nr:glycosyl transferase group 1 [Phycisphaerales bacterium]
MRVTFVLARADLSGGVRVVSIYAQRLLDRGHEVVVVSRPPRIPSLREAARSIITRRPLPSDTRKVASHLDGLGVEHRIIDVHRPITARDVPDADVVVATWWETAEWIAAFPASKGVKAYFIQHFEAHEGIPADRVEATWRLPMHKIIIARWLAELSEQQFGDRSYSLVPNSVDLEQFAVPAREKQPVPTVGVMYSHVPFKGCDISLKAFELAAQRVPGLKLVAFGARQPTADLPLPPGATYVCQPAQSAIKDVYAQADAWLFASRSEGFGLPLLEAMACRTPVIATPAGAAPELLADGGGMLVPQENPQAMADAIESVARLDYRAWRELSDKAHATACRYTWDDATDRFEAALRRAAEKNPAAESPEGRLTPANVSAVESHSKMPVVR